MSTMLAARGTLPLPGATPWPQPPAASAVLISLILDVKPTPKGRPRVRGAEYAMVGGKRTKIRSGHGYTPGRTAAHEEAIGWALRQAHACCNTTDLLGVRAVFYRGGKWDSRPDLDNCLKAVLDAANKIAWADDKQVVQIVSDMVPTKGKPCIEFTVYVTRQVDQ